MTKKSQDAGLMTIFTLARLASGGNPELFPVMMIHFLRTSSSRPLNGPERKQELNPGKLGRHSGRHI